MERTTRASSRHGISVQVLPNRSDTGGKPESLQEQLLAHKFWGLAINAAINIFDPKVRSRASLKDDLIRLIEGVASIPARSRHHSILTTCAGAAYVLALESGIPFDFSKALSVTSLSEMAIKKAAIFVAINQEEPPMLAIEKLGIAENGELKASATSAFNNSSKLANSSFNVVAKVGGVPDRSFNGMMVNPIWVKHIRKAAGMLKGVDKKNSIDAINWIVYERGYSTQVFARTVNEICLAGALIFAMSNGGTLDFERIEQVRGLSEYRIRTVAIEMCSEDPNGTLPAGVKERLAATMYGRLLIRQRSLETKQEQEQAQQPNAPAVSQQLRA